jgi:hypothetical protein
MVHFLNKKKERNNIRHADGRVKANKQEGGVVPGEQRNPPAGRHPDEGVPAGRSSLRQPAFEPACIGSDGG